MATSQNQHYPQDARGGIRGRLWNRLGIDRHDDTEHERPLTWLQTEIIIALGEFCGTFTFLFIGMGAAQVANVAASSKDTSLGLPSLVENVLYIASAFGVSLAVNAWIFYRVSGSLFNPAIAIGLLAAGVINPLRCAMVIAIQLVAGICAAAAVDGLLSGPLLVACRVGLGLSITQGLFVEVLLTCQLVLAVLFLAVEKHKATFMAPIGIGASLFAGHVVGVASTGAAMNPARAFGADVIAGFVGYHWIYWLGPILGSLLAVAVWKPLKILRYHLATVTQDYDDLEMLAYQRWEKRRNTDLEDRLPLGGQGTSTSGLGTGSPAHGPQYARNGADNGSRVKGPEEEVTRLPSQST